MTTPADHEMDEVEAARSVLIEVLTILAKYLDKVVIVGGWVPELVFPWRGHMGSTDVHLALDVERIPVAAYNTIRQNLLKAGYHQTDLPNQFVREVGGPLRVKVDLITGELAGATPTDSHVLVQEMRVWKAHGLDLALLFSTEITVSGTLPGGGRNSVTARVPLIGAFICIKAITLCERMKPKDAYDIYFCVANYPGGPDALAVQLGPLLDHELVQEGLAKLRAKFKTVEEIGPVWAAQVAGENGENRELAQRGAFEMVTALLERLGVP